MQEVLNTISSLIKEYGIIGVLIFIIILLIHDPDRILKIKSIILGCVSSIFRVGEKGYIGSTISYNLDTFFNTTKICTLFSSLKFRFKIKWISGSDDPILKKNGTIIINLSDTRDQTKNILKATQMSLPLLVCPSIRKSVNIEYQNGIDLTLLKKMTDQLGAQAYPVFEKYFLIPTFDNNKDLHDLYTNLVKIDNFGIFIPIFIEELNILSSSYYAEGRTDNITEEIKSFIEYLLKVANRNHGEEIQLLYLEKSFRIGILLVAKRLKAEYLGVKPYLERIRKDFAAGCNKIYIIGFTQNGKFFRDLERILKQDKRYSLKSIRASTNSKLNSYDINLLSLMKNSLLSDNSFQELVETSKVYIGKVIECICSEVLEDLAIFDVNGITSFVFRNECSWSRLISCSDTFKSGHQYSLKVLSIDSTNERLLLTNRKEEEDPKLLSNFPELYSIINIKIVREYTYEFLAFYSEDKIEIIIPKTEISWSDFVDYSKYIDQEIKALIYKVKPDSRIYASIKRNMDNPWSAILEQYPRNSILKGKIIKIDSQGAYFQLPNGLTAFSSSEKISQSKTIRNITEGEIHQVKIDKILTKIKKIYVTMEE